MTEYARTNHVIFDLTERRRRRIATVAGIAIITLILTGIGVLVLWQHRAESAPSGHPFSRHQDAWASALDKTGVESDGYPPGPVALEELAAIGAQEFSATYTPEEVSAILTVYRYQPDAFSGNVMLDRIVVDFPEDGRATIDGRVTLRGNAYNVHAEADVAYRDDLVVISEEGAQFSVEGFSVGGAQRTQAIEAVSEYLNSMLAATPGLTIKSARIVEGGVRVEGIAPQRIEHPDPLPSTRSKTYAQAPF